MQNGEDPIIILNPPPPPTSATVGSAPDAPMMSRPVAVYDAAGVRTDYASMAAYVTYLATHG